MNTLQIDSVLLNEAEQLAKLHNVDLSQMVESFIRRYVEQMGKGNEPAKVTPLCQAIGGRFGFACRF